MTNKNQSKSDKKTRKYKQRSAQLQAEADQLNKECAEQRKKTDKKFEEVGEKVDKMFEKTDKKIQEVAELQRVNSEELNKVVEGLRQVRIASEKNGDEVKEVVEGLRQVRIASEKNGDEVKEVVEGLRQVRIASEKNGDEVKEVVEGLRQVRIASENHGERIGRIGNNLGNYTEAMAMPSIRGILERDFDAEFKGSNLVRNTNNGLDMEVDAWGVSRNGTGAVYVVEIKRKFHDDYIKQIWQTVKRFRVNKPEYRAWAVFPMLAVVDISKEGRAMVWNAGIHLIEINDGVFRYAQPPQDFEADGYHGMPGVRKDVPHLRAVPD